MPNLHSENENFEMVVGRQYYRLVDAPPKPRAETPLKATSDTRKVRLLLLFFPHPAYYVYSDLTAATLITVTEVRIKVQNS